MIKYIFSIDTRSKEKIYNLMNALKDSHTERIFLDSSIKIYQFDTEKQEGIVTNMSIGDYLQSKHNKDKKKKNDN